MTFEIVGWLLLTQSKIGVSESSNTLDILLRIMKFNFPISYLLLLPSYHIYDHASPQSANFTTGDERLEVEEGEYFIQQ